MRGLGYSTCWITITLTEQWLSLWVVAQILLNGYSSEKTWLILRELSMPFRLVIEPKPKCGNDHVSDASRKWRDLNGSTSATNASTTLSMLRVCLMIIYGRLE